MEGPGILGTEGEEQKGFGEEEGRAPPGTLLPVGARHFIHFPRGCFLFYFIIIIFNGAEGGVLISGG